MKCGVMQSNVEGCFLSADVATKLLQTALKLWCGCQAAANRSQGFGPMFLKKIYLALTHQSLNKAGKYPYFGLCFNTFILYLWKMSACEFIKLVDRTRFRFFLHEISDPSFFWSWLLIRIRLLTDLQSWQKKCTINIDTNLQNK